MIGVIADPSDYGVVREFFELFKTPWELYRRGREYEVLLCAGQSSPSEYRAKLAITYAGRKLACEDASEMSVNYKPTNTCSMSYKGLRLPIYGNRVTFESSATNILCDEDSKQSTGYLLHSNDTVLVRVGYDLFAEIRILLTAGQPIANASIPTLELHIMLLRDLIIGNGISLDEIPPVPAGYRFIACLTHDVDHPSIRQHKCDHTMFGFIHRALIGCLIDVLRGRVPARNLLKNWAAVAALPFVHLGLAKDFWLDFDKYTMLENGVSSSFFVIPFKGRPGRLGDNSAPRHRSASYGASKIVGQIQKLMTAGCEIGLHGIDAWQDSASAREELEQIRSLTGKQEIGVRMHWLYFDEKSPAILESAGIDYDSTVGYNATVGFRTGTAQAYKPLEATRLLELPLHVMDTALFFPGYLNLAASDAWIVVCELIESVSQCGGCLTVNWHDRSIAPERLWGEFYVALIDEFKRRGAWLASSAQVVSWFRKRRSAIFGLEDTARGELLAVVCAKNDDQLPNLQLRSYRSNPPTHEEKSGATNTEFMWNPDLGTSVTIMNQPVG